MRHDPRGVHANVDGRISAAAECTNVVGANRTIRALVLSVGLAFLLAGPSCAASAQDLLAARVPIVDQSVGARDEALKVAITQVLVQLTGRADIAHATSIGELIGSPQPYLQQYHYEHGGDGRLELIARFDEQSLRRALARHGIPIWQADRPPVLVWFAFDSSDEQELINEDTGQQPREALRMAAAKLGIPVIFPLLDLQDRQRVRYSDVVGGFSEPVLAASQRYSTELVLMLRVAEARAGWNSRWVLYRDGADTSWESKGASFEQMLADGVQALAASLRHNYTLLPDLSASTQMRIRIEGVGSLEQYAAVESLLTDLLGVTALRLSGAGPDWVRMQLTLNVAPSLVQRELGRSSRLKSAALPALTAPGGGAANNPPGLQGEPTYRLIR